MLYKVECKECYACVRGFDQCEQDAIDAWNTRSPTLQIAGDVREYVKNIINRLIVVKERWDGMQILEGLDEAADAILALSPQAQAGDAAQAKPEPVPFDGEAAIREAAESAAVGAQIVRSDGDLLVYYSGFNLSRFVRYLTLASPPAALPAGEVVKQHISWLFQYVRCMTADNWQDMRDNADRQLERLSEALAISSTHERAAAAASEDPRSAPAGDNNGSDRGPRSISSTDGKPL